MSDKRIHYSEFRGQNLGMMGGKKPFLHCVSYLNRKGFTLIELLVVMAIIAVLSAIMLANYNNFGARQEVKNAAAELKSNLRKYQTYALASQKNPTQVSAGEGCNDPSRVIDYYAVVFYTTAGSEGYQATLWCTKPGTPSTSYHVDLPRVSLRDSTSLAASCDEIRFMPLSQVVGFNCAGPPTQATFTISNAVATYEVTVNSAGEIFDRVVH